MSSRQPPQHRGSKDHNITIDTKETQNPFRRSRNKQRDSEHRNRDQFLVPRDPKTPHLQLNQKIQLQSNQPAGTSSSQTPFETSSTYQQQKAAELEPNHPLILKLAEVRARREQSRIYWKDLIDKKPENWTNPAHWEHEMAYNRKQAARDERLNLDGIDKLEEEIERAKNGSRSYAKLPTPTQPRNYGVSRQRGGSSKQFRLRRGKETGFERKERRRISQLKNQKKGRDGADNRTPQAPQSDRHASAHFDIQSIYDLPVSWSDEKKANEVTKRLNGKITLLKTKLIAIDNEKMRGAGGETLTAEQIEHIKTEDSVKTALTDWRSRLKSLQEGGLASKAAPTEREEAVKDVVEEIGAVYYTPKANDTAEPADTSKPLVPISLGSSAGKKIVDLGADDGTKRAENRAVEFGDHDSHYTAEGCFIPKFDTSGPQKDPASEPVASEGQIFHLWTKSDKAVFEEAEAQTEAQRLEAAFEIKVKQGEIITAEKTPSVSVNTGVEQMEVYRNASASNLEVGQSGGIDLPNSGRSKAGLEATSGSLMTSESFGLCLQSSMTIGQGLGRATNIPFIEEAQTVARPRKSLADFQRTGTSIEHAVEPSKLKRPLSHDDAALEQRSATRMRRETSQEVDTSLLDSVLMSLDRSSSELANSSVNSPVDSQPIRWHTPDEGPKPETGGNLQISGGAPVLMSRVLLKHKIQDSESNIPEKAAIDTPTLEVVLNKANCTQIQARVNTRAAPIPKSIPSLDRIKLAQAAMQGPRANETEKSFPQRPAVQDETTIHETTERFQRPHIALKEGQNGWESKRMVEEVQQKLPSMFEGYRQTDVDFHAEATVSPSTWQELPADGSAESDTPKRSPDRARLAELSSIISARKRGGSIAPSARTSRPPPLQRRPTAADWMNTGKDWTNTSDSGPAEIVDLEHDGESSSGGSDSDLRPTENRTTAWNKAIESRKYFAKPAVLGTSINLVDTLAPPEMEQNRFLPLTNRVLYVGNLAPSVSKRDLESLFEQFSSNTVLFPHPTPNGFPTDYAFVVCQSAAGAELGVKNNSDLILQRRRLVVRLGHLPKELGIEWEANAAVTKKITQEAEEDSNNIEDPNSQSVKWTFRFHASTNQAGEIEAHENQQNGREHEQEARRNQREARAHRAWSPNVARVPIVPSNTSATTTQHSASSSSSSSSSVSPAASSIPAEQIPASRIVSRRNLRRRPKARRTVLVHREGTHTVEDAVRAKLEDPTISITRLSRREKELWAHYLNGMLRSIEAWKRKSREGWKLLRAKLEWMNREEDLKMLREELREIARK